MGFEGEAGPLILETDDLDPNLPARFGLHRDEYLVIHPTSRWSFKEWEVEKWHEVITHVRESMGLKVLLTSGPDPREIDIVRQLARENEGVVATEGKTSLRETALLIKQALLFVGIDTVAMHIASAVQTPTVALFGPTDEWSWHPWKVPHRLVSGICPCKEVRKFTCDKSKLLPCMASIDSHRVLDAIKTFLKR
jgi:heptosyltransferase-3